MAVLDDLQTAYERIVEELATGDIAPSYALDGQSVSWEAYRASLIQQAKDLRELILLEGVPCEEWTYAVPVGGVRN